MSMPTAEIRLASTVAESLGDRLPDDAITKRTKAHVTARVDHETAAVIHDWLREAAGEDDITTADSKRLRKAADELAPTVRSLATQTADVHSFDLKQHPIGSLVPEMSRGEKAELAKSMKAHGFLPAHPIVMHEGMVLDGWHRYREAVRQGIDIHAKDYRGDDPVGYVLAANVRRRHLTDDQKAIVAGELAACDPNMTTAAAAAQVKVKAWNAGVARRLVRMCPTLAGAVRDGSVTLSDAVTVTTRDPDMIEHLNGDDIGQSISDLVAESIVRTKPPKVTTVRLALDDAEPWTHAEIVFDVNGDALGEAYWRPLPIPLGEIDTDPIIARVADQCGWSTQKKAVRAAIRETLDDREISALFFDFEGAAPPADMSPAKREIAVAAALVDWFASADDGDSGDGES